MHVLLGKLKKTKDYIRIRGSHVVCASLGLATQETEGQNGSQLDRP